MARSSNSSESREKQRTGDVTWESANERARQAFMVLITRLECASDTNKIRLLFRKGDILCGRGLKKSR
jgi:hypothetical protein